MDESVQTEESARPEDALLTMDEVLDSDEAKAEPEQDTGEESAEVESAEEPEAEEESEAEETEDKGEPPSPETKEDSHVPLKAVMEEREKRRAAQKEAEELRKQLDELQKEPDKPKKSVFEDEAGFRQELLDEFQAARLNDRLEISQALAEDKYGEDKVAEATETFRELAESNPELAKRFASARSPYHEMMRIVEQHEQAKQLDPENIEKTKAEIRAELEAELRQEYEGKAKERDEKRKSIGPSLASKRSTGGVTDETSLIGAEDAIPE